jgi:hypothetical protein
MGLMKRKWKGRKGKRKETRLWREKKIKKRGRKIKSDAKVQ